MSSLMSSHANRARALADAMETETYYGFNLRMELIWYAKNEPDKLAIVEEVLAKVREVREKIRGPSTI